MTTPETVRQLVDQWAAAVRAKDLEAVLAHHADDIRLFDVPPPTEQRGLDAYRRSWTDFFAWMQPEAFTVEELEVVDGADVAFGHGVVRCAGTDPDGTTSELDVRLTIGLRRNVDGWEVVHEHHSEPSAPELKTK